MEPAHLNLGSIQGGSIHEGFPRAQGRLLGLEQGLLQEDTVKTAAPPKLNWVINDQTQDAHCSVRGPTPSIITTVLEDGLGEGNLSALEGGQVPHHGGGKTVESITDEGSLFDWHDIDTPLLGV